MNQQVATKNKACMHHDMLVDARVPANFTSSSNASALAPATGSSRHAPQAHASFVPLATYCMQLIRRRALWYPCQAYGYFCIRAVALRPSSLSIPLLNAACHEALVWEHWSCALTGNDMRYHCEHSNPALDAELDGAWSPAHALPAAPPLHGTGAGARTPACHQAGRANVPTPQPGVRRYAHAALLQAPGRPSG